MSISINQLAREDLRASSSTVLVASDADGGINIGTAHAGKNVERIASVSVGTLYITCNAEELGVPAKISGNEAELIAMLPALRKRAFALLAEHMTPTLLAEVLRENNDSIAMAFSRGRDEARRDIRKALGL